MDITPTPEFLEACRRIVGGDTPGVVIPALRDPELSDQIREEHMKILDEKKAAAR